MKRIRFRLAAVLIIFFICCASSPERAYAIEGYGDHSLWVLVNDIKKAFEKDTGIPLYLLEELAIASKGCAKGINHAFKGNPDNEFGLICCELKEDTVKKYGLKIYPVINEPLAIIANKKNPVKGLTLAQVRDVFSGNITEWRKVGGGSREKIVVITRLHCREHIPNWTKILSHPDRFRGERMDVSSEPDMARTVADFRNAIGHLEMTSIAEVKGDIKILPIDGYMPTSENMQRGLYPLYAVLSVVTKGEAGDKVMAFIEYLRKSPRVKEAMQRYGMQQIR